MSLFVGITTFGGDGGRSGISRYIQHLLRGFARRRGELRYEVLLHRGDRGVFGVAELSACELSDCLRPPIANIAWHQLRLPGLCRERGYDVLLLPAANRRLPFRAPCRTVGTFHDCAAWHVAHKYDRLRMLYIERFLPILVRRLDRVLTVSESSKRDIVELSGVPPERIVVTPLAADERFVPGDPERAFARIGPKYGLVRPMILYVSRIEHPGKNHLRLIQAFARLRWRLSLPHHLVLAGSDWSGAEVVHRAAQSSGCAPAIHFTGFVPDTDLPDLYSSADLFVFPSLYEGFGLPLLEAMGCGIPVCCANTSSLPEVAGQAALLFDPNDEESMGAQMEKLLTDEQHRRSAVQSGFLQARSYSWEATVARTVAVLKEVAGSPER